MLSLVRLSVKRQLYGAVRSIEPPKVTALNSVALPVRQPIIVEDRRKSTAGKPQGKVIESASKNLLDTSLHVPSITESVAYSDITVGGLRPGQTP